MGYVKTIYAGYKENVNLSSIGSIISTNFVELSIADVDTSYNTFKWLVKENLTDDDSEALSGANGTITSSTLPISFTLHGGYVKGKKYYLGVKIAKTGAEEDLEIVQVSFTVLANIIDDGGGIVNGVNVSNGSLLSRVVTVESNVLQTTVNNVNLDTYRTLGTFQVTISSGHPPSLSVAGNTFRLTNRRHTRTSDPSNFLIQELEWIFHNTSDRTTLTNQKWTRRRQRIIGQVNPADNTEFWWTSWTNSVSTLNQTIDINNIAFHQNQGRPVFLESGRTYTTTDNVFLASGKIEATNATVVVDQFDKLLIFNDNTTISGGHYDASNQVTRRDFPRWQANTAVVIGQKLITPNLGGGFDTGKVRRSNADRTTGAVYDASEEEFWNASTYNEVPSEDEVDIMIQIEGAKNVLIENTTAYGIDFMCFAIAGAGVTTENITLSNNHWESEGVDDMIGFGRIHPTGFVRGMHILGGSYKTRTGTNPLRPEYAACANGTGVTDFTVTGGIYWGDIFGGVEEDGHLNINWTGYTQYPALQGANPIREQAVYGLSEVVTNNYRSQLTKPTRHVVISNANLNRSVVRIIGDPAFRTQLVIIDVIQSGIVDTNPTANDRGGNGIFVEHADHVIVRGIIANNRRGLHLRNVGHLHYDCSFFGNVQDTEFVNVSNISNARA